MSAGSYTGQKRVWDPLPVVSCLMWVRGIELGASARAVHAFDLLSYGSSQVLFLFLIRFEDNYVVVRCTYFVMIP